MPDKLQIEQPKEDKVLLAKRDTLNDHIKKQVIHALGTPCDLQQVQVRKVWDDHYRVNIIVGMSVGSVKIANSFFLQTDRDGRLIASTPKITKEY